MARITSHRYPYLRVGCRIGEWRWEGWALIDTGFDGHLVLPLAALLELPSPPHSLPVQQADGTVADVPCYRGFVSVLGIDSYRGDVALLGDEYIIGRSVIDLLRVTFDHGQRVIVES